METYHLNGRVDDAVTHQIKFTVNIEYRALEADPSLKKRLVEMIQSGVGAEANRYPIAVHIN
jgi:hypothetical protein